MFEQVSRLRVGLPFTVQKLSKTTKYLKQKLIFLSMQIIINLYCGLKLSLQPPCTGRLHTGQASRTAVILPFKLTRFLLSCNFAKQPREPSRTNAAGLALPKILLHFLYFTRFSFCAVQCLTLNTDSSFISAFWIAELRSAIPGTRKLID